MVWYIRTQERVLGDKALGLFHLTATSDEDGGGPFGLCDHDHPTADEADQCPEARKRAEMY